MQNQVRFLISRQVCAIVRMAIQMVAMAPPTKEGVYGQSTYSGVVSDIVWDERLVVANVALRVIEVAQRRKLSVDRAPFGVWN
jgi:hypothetical protein